MSPPRIRPGSGGTGSNNGRPPRREDPVSTNGDGVVDETDEPDEAEAHGTIDTLLAASQPVETRHGIFRRLYFGETRFDFVRRKRIWFAASAIVISLGGISLGVRGLNFGIDFVGGTSWTIVSQSVTVSQAATVVAPIVGGATVTQLGSNTAHSRSIEVQAKLPKGQSATEQQTVSTNVSKALATLLNPKSPNIEQVSVDSVGPSWGSQITDKAAEALVVFFILIALYISIFFEWRMAFAAIVAVLHDIAVTVGIYSISGFEVTPDTVVAFLTILGYSLYDTIVVFDRVRDNVKNLSVRDRMTFTDVVNVSMNQTLARSLNTSLVAIMPIFAVLVLGAEILGASTLQYFGLALLVGLMTGAYSSIFIASPLVAVLKEREPRYRQLRERLALRGVGPVLLSATAVASGSAELRPIESRERRVVRGRIRPGDATAEADAQDADDVAQSSVTPRTAGPTPARRPPARRTRRGGRR